MKDLTGRKFGRLVVFRRVPTPKHVGSVGRTYWRCVCKCGEHSDVEAYNLLQGLVRSCGCLAVDTSRKLFTTHGGSKLPEYRIWSGMITRCTNNKRAQWKDYGGRGIKVCRHWRNSFGAFLKDVGRRPSKQHTLDRFPNLHGDYKPGNVRWATKAEQMQLTRRSRLIKFRGENLSLAVWGRRLGFVDGSGVRWRLLQGWSVEKALTTRSDSEVS